VLKRATAFVSGDTRAVAFAAGVGVPTLALFGRHFAGALGPDWRTPPFAHRQPVPAAAM